MPSPVVVVCVSQDGLEPTVNFFLLPILYLPSVEITGVFHLPWLFCILESDLGLRHARQALTLPTELYPSVKLRCYDRLALFQDLILKAAIAL